MLQCTSYIYLYVVELSKTPQIHILHILWQPHEHANRQTNYHFKDPLEYYDLDPNMLLIHFITDHMTEIRSAKALRDKCLSNGLSFTSLIEIELLVT